MTVFLDDPNVAIDNNAIERALRGVVLGRKNHYGSKSRRGTEVAAILYSMIESAKLVGINPEEYFKTAIAAHLDGKKPRFPTKSPPRPRRFNLHAKFSEHGF